MSLWDAASEMVTTTALVFSPPQIAGAIVQRLNEIDRINSQFALQGNQQEFQARMQGNQQEFQAIMQGNQQEFQANVEKLRTAAQFALQAKGQAFQADLEAVKIDTQFALQDRGHEFQAALEGVRQRFNREMEEYRQFCENARLQKRQDFEQEQLTRRLQHEQSLEAYRRETQLILSRAQLLMALELADDKEVRESFPLKTPARVILNAYKNYQNNLSPIPLLVVISPPALEFEKFPNAAQGFSRIEARLTDEVQEFCKHYPLTSEARPVRYQGADWETKSAHGKSAVDVLHHVLKSVPTVVLESKVDGDLLRIYLAGWDVLEKTPHYEKVLTVPWKEVLYPIARKYAQKWREYRMTLLDKNKTLEEIKRRGGDDELNLSILEEEEEDKEFGFGGKEDYKYNVKEEKYIQELSQFLGICHCILVGLMADRYHFTHGDTPPKLPELLPGLLEKVPSQSLKEMLVAEIVTSYQSLYQLTGVERPNAIPYLFLDLALSLSGLPDKSWAKNQVEYSLLCWLSLRNRSNGVVAEKSGLRELLTVFTSALMDADAEYLQKLIACLSRFEGDYQQMMQEAMQQHAIELKRQQEAELKRQQKGELKPQQKGGLKRQQKGEHQNQLQNASVVRLFTQKSNVTCLAISPDGDTLVSGSADKTIKIWQLSKGKKLRTLKGHSHGVTCLAISPDGQTLISGIGEDIKIWDLSTGQALGTLDDNFAKVYGKVITCLAISPDGETLISGSDDNTIKIWEFSTGWVLRRLKGHSSKVNSLAISPDGQILVSGSEDNTIKIWELSTGQEIRTFTGHSGGVACLAISPDGQTLISGSGDNTIKIWQLSTGKELLTLTGHSHGVTCLAISPDGQTLISGSKDRRIKIWDLSTGQELGTLNGHYGPVTCLAISADGQTLVSGSEDQTIKVWRVV